MADESAAHSDCEVEQEHRFCLKALPIGQTPIEKRHMSFSNAFFSCEKFIDPITVLRELQDLFVDHVTWLRIMAQQDDRQKAQQEESNILFPNEFESQRSFDSYYHKKPIFIHGSVDGASYKPVHFFPRVNITKWKRIYKILFHTSDNVFDALSFTDSYIHPGPWPRSQSCQRSKYSQSQFSHKTWLLWHKNKKEKEKQTFLNSLKYNTCAALKLVRKILELVSTTMDLLDDANMSVNTIQDELLEWLRKIEQISNRLLEKLRRVYTQLVIYAVIFFWLFEEYPNGIRHLCTTMPWTIWPALVVLWGVCWMFHSGPVPCAVAEAERTLPPDHQEQLLSFQGEFCHIDNSLSSS